MSAAGQGGRGRGGAGGGGGARGAGGGAAGRSGGSGRPGAGGRPGGGGAGRPSGGRPGAGGAGRSGGAGGAGRSGVPGGRVAGERRGGPGQGGGWQGGGSGGGSGQGRSGGQGGGWQGGGSGGGSGQGRSGGQGGGRPGGDRRSPAGGIGRPGSKWPSRPARPAAPRRRSEPTVDVHDPEGVRLQKVLAQAGLGSRRACEELISAGRVSVDDQVVTELGVRVDPLTSVIHVDGLRLQLDQSMITIALNKPLGVVSTMHDPEGRPSLAEFVQGREERLFHVGRLDADSEGLILLTNDGELANRLSHPSHGVTKTYLATVDGRVSGGIGARLRKGVELEDGVVAVDDFRLIDQTPQASLVEIVLHEGRNRVVRRLLEEVGYPVTRLLRVQIGPIKLGDLPPGRTRVLGKAEVGSLMTSVGM
nr:pseudouridine synthase [Cellulomonas endometrii]